VFLSKYIKEQMCCCC